MTARLPLAAALLLALAACKVDVEGAPCAAPGSAADCPGGQACGNDLRCSLRAAGCAASRCAPGSVSCADAARGVRCTDADPVCGSLEALDCAAAGLVCDAGRSGCACPAPAVREIAVDPNGPRDVAAFPFPTGSQSPAACRFGRLGDAFAAAEALAADGGGDVGVKVYTDAVSPTFGAATGEAWPLVISSVVQFIGSGAVIRGGPGVAAGGPLLVVRRGATSFTVDGGGATGVGILVEAQGALIEVNAVTILGRASVDPPGLSTGVLVKGDATLSYVNVSDVKGPALDLDPGEDATVIVSGGSYGASRLGLWLRSGTAIVRNSAKVNGNLDEGIRVAGNGAFNVRDELHVDLAEVADNGGTGITFVGAKAGSRLDLYRADVHGNGAVWATVHTPSFPIPNGGLYLTQIGLGGLRIEGSRFWANAGAQVGIDALGPAVVGTTAACGWTTNRFACLGTGRSLSALGPKTTLTSHHNVGVEPAFAGTVNVVSTCTDGPGVPANPCP